MKVIELSQDVFILKQAAGIRIGDILIYYIFEQLADMGWQGLCI